MWHNTHLVRETRQHKEGGGWAKFANQGEGQLAKNLILGGAS